MSEALKTLLGVLDRQKAVYTELLSLAEQQGGVLIARRTNALEEIEARQSALLSQASRLEIAAVAVLRELGETMSMGGVPTVSEIAARLETSEATTLNGLCADIRTVAKRLSRVIRANAELFESAMDCVRFTVQLLAGGCQPTPVCYPLMEAKRQRASLMVDQRA